MKKRCWKGSMHQLTKLFWPTLIICFVLLSFTNPVAAQIKINGVISETSGETMPGVNVMIKGTKTGVVTDVNGRYSITVPDARATLVFSFIGYISQEVAIGDKRQIDIVMKEDLMEIEEVVILGFSQAKRDITGAITSVNEKSIAAKQPVSIFDALQGAAPGVQILSNTGEPGAEGKIRIRGASTLSDDGANPLYIVDGVQMDNINTINPNDIKSIEILKDAASAAIYGSRSANGVIIVTTKQGLEGKPQVSVNYLNSYSTLSHQIPQSNRLEREIFDRYNSVGLAPNANDSTAFNKNADNNYQDLMTQTAIRNQVDVSIGGGSEQMKYRGSIQYLNDEGIILNTFNKRLSGRFNINYKATDKLDLVTNVNFSYTNKSNTNEGKVIQQALQRPPHMTLYFPDGSWMYDNGGRKNPEAEAYLRQNETQKYQGIIFQAANYRFTGWLSAHGDIAATITMEDTEVFNSKLLETANPPVNSGNNATKMTSYIQGNFWINLAKTFNDTHNLSGMVGGTFEKNNIKNMKIAGQNYITESVTTLNSAGELVSNQTFTNKTQNALVGFFGRVGYDYKSRYLFNAALRIDGSSRFGNENRWGYFPSASVGWRFSDESFFNWARPVLTDGKIRFSAGMTGQQDIGDYEARNQYVIGSYGYNGVGGVRPATKMGNPLLKWESTTQYNGGIDLSLLDGRVSFIGDIYLKDTKDLLYDMSMPYELGYSDGMRVNLGKIRNKGIELAVTWRVIETRDFSWTTTANWSTNKNEIIDLPGGDRIDDIWWIGAGSEAGTFFGWKQQGVYQYKESNAWTSDYKTRLTPVFEKDEFGNVVLNKRKEPNLMGYTLPDGTPYSGDVRQQSSSGSVLGGGDFIWEELPDANGNINGDVGNEDRQVIGQGQPKWYAGWQNTVRYKGFTLSFSFYANFGNSVYNEERRNRALFSITNMTPDPYIVYNFWKYPGQMTDVYRRANFTGNTRKGGDYFLEDASFIRLQSLRLSYSLKDSWAKKALLRNAEIFVYGNNLFTWTNYTGFDPEVNQTSVLKPGEDPGRYPRKREMGFGINLNF